MSARCECTVDMNLVYLILDLACGILTCAVAMVHFVIPAANTLDNMGGAGWQQFFLGLYIFLFGFVLGMVAIVAPYCITVFLRFVLVLFGKSMSYIFLGLILMCPTDQTLQFITVIVLLVVGALYLILSFVRTVPRPRPYCVIGGNSNSFTVTRTTNTTWTSYGTA